MKVLNFGLFDFCTGEQPFAPTVDFRVAALGKIVWVAESGVNLINRSLHFLDHFGRTPLLNREPSATRR